MTDCRALLQALADADVEFMNRIAELEALLFLPLIQ